MSTRNGDPVGHQGDVPTPHAGGGAKPPSKTTKPADQTYSPEALAYYRSLGDQQRQANIANAPGINGVPLDAHELIAQLPPEVQNVFNEALAKAGAGTPLGQDAIQSMLQQTNWSRTTPDTQKNVIWQRITDPAEATLEHNRMAFKVLQAASQMGRPMTLAQAATMADQYINNDWNDAQLQNALATTSLGHSQQWQAGSLQTATNNVMKTASDYGIQVNPLTAASWGQRIAAGSTDQAAFTDYAQHQAAINHPYWTKEIANGATVRQLADPWIQTASRLLEVDPGQVDLTQPKWNFTTHDPKAGTTPMSQSAWAQKIMTDNQYGWDKTQNAHQAAFGMVDQLRQTFGAQ